MAEMDRIWEEAKKMKGVPETMKYFLCVLGMVFVIEGLPYFTFPAQIKTYLLKLTEIPDIDAPDPGRRAAVSSGLLLIYFGTTVKKEPSNLVDFPFHF